MEIRKIVILGTGNVATVLVPLLKRSGFGILQVYGRTQSKAMTLARKAGASWTSDPFMIDPGADLYVLAVSDDAIRVVAARMKRVGGLVVHTSGATGIHILDDLFPECGVLYPVQTFRGSRTGSFRNIPLCIEANSSQGLDSLRQFAEKLSGKTMVLSGEERLTVHLAAVVANNFGNYLNSIAEVLMNEKGLPFNILYPLIRKTARNACLPEVFSRQTGPAVREDTAIILEHMARLKDHPDYLKIYRIMTDAIKKGKHTHDQL